MIDTKPNIIVNVDVTNPGQFFACCGLLELIDRFWRDARAWFKEDKFCVECNGSPLEMLAKISEVPLVQVDPLDDMASPIRLATPRELTLDWWMDDLTGGKGLKVWAGSMRNVRIARAMQNALVKIHDPQRMFEHAVVVYDPDNRRKKVEPYYFDSRRGCNAQSLDIGFAPDSLKMTTAAYPAVEFLCLVGLQRFRPAPTDQRRAFTYCTWSKPLPIETASVAASGTVRTLDMRAYRFENAFRTDQKKHKSFLPATSIGVFA